METYLSLLVLVSISYVCGLQFEDDADTNLGQAKQSDSSVFFPTNDAPDERYSEISGIKYIDPQSYQNENRKQLNYNGNLIRPMPPGGNQVQYYQPNPYRPMQAINSPTAVNVIRKRPANFPYQHVSASPSNQYNSYPADLTNPFYQNYANHYQYPSATASSPSSYPDYYNPTRYPSPMPSANINGQQPLLHQPSPSLEYPNYYTNNYANQFGYQRPSSVYGNSGVGGSGGDVNGISSFFNNFRQQTGGSFGQISQVGGQFGKALEDISANDDLQCVPKILCQMVKSARRPNQLPSFMNVPGLSAIISALPSSSPLMNFGRAALLGLSGAGECDSAYPKCPRDEEQMLLYMNNHRGGFFRFFNGGNSFGEDNLLQQYGQQQQQQYGQQQYDTPSSGVGGGGQGLSLSTLQALAESLNQGNGINLGNLFSSPSNQRPTVQRYPQGLPADQTQSSGFFGMFNPSMLSDAVSNLLTGIVGNRFSRRLSKRSLPDESIAEGHHTIQKRIVNVKTNNEREQVQNFFEGSSSDQHQTTLYDVEAPFTFSNGNRINIPQQFQQISALKFPTQQEISLAEVNHGNFISPSEVARYLKMLFPESVGLIRLDNDQFNRELLRALVNDRIKTLTGVQQQRPINNNYDVNRYQGYQNYNSNQQQQNYQKYPAQSQNYYAGSSNYDNINTNYINKGQQEQSSGARKHIVYITNSRGQTEYELNELTGEKKRVI